jgi:uncharacterized repeat protein (TIGR01451 family)
MAAYAWDWGYVPGDTSVICLWGGDVWGYMCDSLSSTISLTLDSSLTYAGMWYGPAPTVSGSTLSWTFATAGDMLDFFGAVMAVTPSTDTLGTPVCNTVYVTPTVLTDPADSNNAYSWCEAVAASFDPNGKEVSPIGRGTEGYIANGTRLSYMVHFQNTGTAAARNIMIRDTINSNLDIATLQILKSSAPVKVTEAAGNVVIFTFSNINLPDSAANPHGSTGFVSYSIMPRPSLAGGTQIKNKAAIYFDYNAPVYTGTTLNTIEIPTAVSNIAASSPRVDIYPNPANDRLTVTANVNVKPLSLSISNLLGEVVLSRQITANQTNLDIHSLPSGVYFVTVKDEQGATIKKLVKL